MFDDFLTRAVIAGIGIALVTGPMGCFVVWRRLAYFGETIAHSALLGVALAVVVGVDYTIGVLVSSIVIVLLMLFIDRVENLPTETLLALLAHGGLALGLVILSFFPLMRVNLEALLFGDILAVSKRDLVVVAIGGACVLGCLMVLWRPLLAATVNAELAETAGMKPRLAQFLFGLLMAVVIAGAVKIVGILLIVALLILPAATARKFSFGPESMASLAAFVGVLGVIGGLSGSAYLDTPSGPSIVVVVLALFALTRLVAFQIEKRRS